MGQDNESNNSLQEKKEKKLNNSGIYIVIMVIILITIGAFIFYFWQKITALEQALSPISKPITNTNTLSKAGFKANNEFLKVIFPTVNQKITSPVQVSGKSNFFEANTRIRIVDKSGNVLADTFTTADGWMDNLYPFSASVEYSQPFSSEGAVEIFEDSPKDGSEKNKISIPVIFQDKINSVSPPAAKEIKTYKNSYPAYAMKYPSDWKVDSSKASAEDDSYSVLELVLIKGEYKLLVRMPNGWGPSVCQFNDSLPSDFEAAGVYEIKGDYVKIKPDKYTLRRSLEPTRDEVNKKSIWSICQKESESEYFTTATMLQIIRYEAPLNFDPEIIKEMDSIIKTVEIN